MVMKSALLLLLSMLFAGLALADTELRVAIVPNQIQDSIELGKTHVDGVGEVILIGSKNGNQLVVYAHDPNGSVIGKAETVVGLRDTPIYVKTSTGLEKITIYWASD